MSSTSAAGVSIVHAAVQPGAGADVAEQEVQAAINAGASLLPADLPRAARLCQGEPGRRAVSDAGRQLRHHAAHRGAEPGQHPAGAEDQPGAGRGPGHTLAAASALPCASRPTPRPWPPTACASTRCAPPSPPPTPTAPRAASTGRSGAYNINANDQLVTPDDYKRLILTGRTARRCACQTWPARGGRSGKQPLGRMGRGQRPRPRRAGPPQASGGPLGGQRTSEAGSVGATLTPSII